MHDGNNTLRVVEPEISSKDLTLTFRQSISRNKDEQVIFCTDILSEPQREVFAKINPFVNLKSSRALPIALDEDIVVISGTLEPEYYAWLRSLGLGPKTVVAYNHQGTDKSLSELIIEDSSNIEKEITKSGRQPVLVPFYSGQTEAACAKLLSAELFGAPTGVCDKYFNKDTFKKICQSLEIPTVEGESHTLNQNKKLDIREIEKLVSSLLSNYSSVLIRGEMGSSGSSLYKTNCPSEIADLYLKMKANNDTTVLVEPLLNVIASPNDQWVINRDREISHIGLTGQLFKDLKHAGNIKGLYFSERIYDYITSASKVIVEEMARDSYTGVLGIDYIVTEKGIYPIENNARLNGSTFTYGLVDRVEETIGKVSCWKFFKAKSDPQSFNSLAAKLGPLLYDGTAVNRIFPYDCDTLTLNGSFAAVILAEDFYHLEHLEQALQTLGVHRVI
ncbi:MAG: hypothetical protein R3A13_02690 [Bdellovibrionota bacterium]